MVKRGVDLNGSNGSNKIDKIFKRKVLDFVELALVVIEEVQYPLHTDLTNGKHYFEERALNYIICSSAGRELLVQALIRQGADVDWESGDGESPLSNAVKNEHIEIIKILLNAGAIVDTCDEYGCTPFMNASSEGWW